LVDPSAIDAAPQQDASRRQRLQSAAVQVELRQAFLDAMPIAACVVGQRGGQQLVLARNAHWQKLDVGQKEAARSEDPSSPLLSRLDCADRIDAVLTGERADDSFVWRDGGMVGGRHFSVAVAPLMQDGKGTRALLTLSDRTAEVETARSLRRQMLEDPLTGLLNRSGFVEALELRIIDDGAQNYAVAVIDLVRFSRVNDCIGSLGGDELIITVARRLLSTLRTGDLLGRTGANEFAIAVRLADGPGDVLHIARRVEAVLTAPCRLSDFEIKIDCAIGCALPMDGGGDAERLIRHAQLALKSAKLTQRVEVYQPSALDAARRRFTIETDLRRAIERGELTLAYQPLMSLRTGRIAGFEALARWHHAEQGWILPNDFIPVAEDSGLIVPLGRWALNEALRQLAAWDAAAGHAMPVYVAVNMSAIQIARDDVPAQVAAALATHGVTGRRLSIELTESTIVADPDRATRTLDALKACDVMVAMDDFGTGFSNLASLQRLPIDMLKIDRSFVGGMLDDPDKVAIVRAIIGLAQALGMTTTAEGVETPELARMLAALGCTTGQGYVYSVPLPAEAAFDFAINALR